MLCRNARPSKSLYLTVIMFNVELADDYPPENQKEKLKMPNGGSLMFTRGVFRSSDGSVVN